MAERDTNERAFWKIVITGGPCAGKTTGMTWIQNTFEKMGYLILFISEPATEMMTAGVTPVRCSTPMAYQQFQMKLQFEKEKLFERAAADIAYAEKSEDAGKGPEQADAVSEEAGGRKAGRNSEVQRQDPGDVREPRKVLVVCDRGFMDNRAYMTEEEFQQVLAELGTTEKELLRGYDGVFHLETTAKNAVAYFGNENNAVRGETPEQARELDDRVIRAWEKHPQHHLIENLSGFEDKMRHLVAEIAALLGEQSPPEIRRRYLIDYPDVEGIKNLSNGQVIESEISQVYLRSDEDEEIRIRMQEVNAEQTYYMTRKKIKNGKRYLVSENRLSKREYVVYLGNSDPKKGGIQKRRYSLTWKKQRYDADIYSFWQDRALLEISLSSENQKIEFPPVFTIRKEVTGDENYEISFLAAKNAAASRDN